MGTGSFPEGKERPGRDADPSPPSSAVVKKGYSYTSALPMDRMACTEPQCLYNGAFYLTFFDNEDQSFNDGLGAMYRVSILYVITTFVHSTLVKTFKDRLP